MCYWDVFVHKHGFSGKWVPLFCSFSSSTSLILVILILLPFRLSNDITMRSLLAATSLVAILSVSAAQLCSPYAPCSGTNFPALINVTLDDLRGGLSQRLFTSVDLVNTYIDRINEVNGTLSMVTEINPDAVAIAQQLDQERAHNMSRGPLHGIPVLIKNNIATDDAMNNTAGSFSLLGAKVPRDSTMAAKLRQAGAIILGKAVSRVPLYRQS